MAGPEPDIGDARRNWARWDGPLREKLHLAARNNLIKLKTRSNCCGNHGEPGC